MTSETLHVTMKNGEITIPAKSYVARMDADELSYDNEHFKGTLVDKTFTNVDIQNADHYLRVKPQA